MRAPVTSSTDIDAQRVGESELPCMMTRRSVSVISPSWVSNRARSVSIWSVPTCNSGSSLIGSASSSVASSMSGGKSSADVSVAAGSLRVGRSTWHMQYGRG